MWAKKKIEMWSIFPSYLWEIPTLPNRHGYTINSIQYFIHNLPDWTPKAWLPPARTWLSPTSRCSALSFRSFSSLWRCERWTSSRTLGVKRFPRNPLTKVQVYKGWGVLFPCCFLNWCAEVFGCYLHGLLLQTRSSSVPFSWPIGILLACLYS